MKTLIYFCRISLQCLFLKQREAIETKRVKAAALGLVLQHQERLTCNSFLTLFKLSLIHQMLFIWSWLWMKLKSPHSIPSPSSISFKSRAVGLYFSIGWKINYLCVGLFSRFYPKYYIRQSAILKKRDHLSKSQNKLLEMEATQDKRGLS